MSTLAFVGAAMFALSYGGHATAAAPGGAVKILVGEGSGAGSPLSSGAVDTLFTLQPTVAGASCTGDTATGGYKVQSYMVPAAVDPSTLTFDNVGPLPHGTGASFRAPLYALGTPFVNKNTAVTTGLLTGLPAFDFTAFTPNSSTSIPDGIYNIGYACTKGTAGPTQLDKYWNVQITVAGVAGEVAWSLTPQTPPSSTSSSSSTTSSSTSAPSSSNSSTSSSIVSSSSSSSAVSTSSSIVDTTTDSSFSSSTALVDYGAGGGALGNTGADTSTLVLWAIAVLFAGRMVQLLARRVRVTSSDQR
jgi:hypothetical protein